MARSLGLAALLAVLLATSAPAATLEPVGTFAQPIFVTSDPEDPDRLFVVEREGRVAEVTDAGPVEYADLTEWVLCCNSEQGLLSIALAPDFPTSGLFYAAYTGDFSAGSLQGDIHVDAFVAGPGGSVTRTPIISVPHDRQANHNGGQIQFGPDGHLYISTGDGGGGGDPFEAGQDLNTLLGKVLRIDPSPGSSPPYAIPPGNPFAGATTGADEIWAFGLRNPWRFSFDSLTGSLLIADVGQSAREEVNLAVSPAPGAVGGAGANYGWSCREGLIAYTDSTPSANCEGAGGFTDPIFDYPHTDPGGGKAHGCSITGGYVVRDPSLTGVYGRYLYADFCVGEVRSLGLPAGAGAVTDDRAEGIAMPQFSITSFGEDSCDRLYVVSGSSVFRFVGDSPADCTKPSEEPPGEEEPPVEEPPPGIPPGEQVPAVGPPLMNVSIAAPRRRVRIGLGGRFERFFAIQVRVSPCPMSGNGSVQLNRGGEPLRAKALDPSCRARFLLRNIHSTATFRALVEFGEGGVYRSQVLKIALAKPTP